MDRILIIGASSGGPPVLFELLPQFPKDFPHPILVVQHMPPGFIGPMAEFLDEQSNLRVLEARQNDVIRPGQILIAAAPFHLRLRQSDDEVLASLSQEPRDSVCSPRIDCTLETAAPIYGEGVCAVVLTGMSAGNDCVAGAAAVKAAGGTVIIQDEATSACYYMPKAVKDAGLSDYEVSKDDLCLKISQVMGEEE